MQVFKCKICEEVYLGKEKPTNCPYCGAHSDRIILAKDWKKPEIELTQISRENLEKALKLEVDNASFYLCASQKAEKQKNKDMFKRLSKVEKEHAEVISKALGTEEPEIKPEVCSSDTKKNLKSASRRENRATRFYSQALGEANEDRVREIFSALVEVEEDHLTLLAAESK